MLTQHIKQPVVAVRTLLSLSAAFQSLTGSADATAALARIHYGYAEDKDGTSPAQAAKPYPRANVGLSDFRSRNGGTWKNAIQISCEIEAPTPEAEQQNSLGSQYLWWLGEIETIIDQVKAESATGEILVVKEIQLSVPPHMTDRFINKKPIWSTEFIVSAGALS